MDLPRAVSLMVFAYLVGSIPFSFLVARAWGVDLRRVGSSNIGAANVWRNCGPLAALLALAGDLLKGALPTLIAASLGLPDALVALVGAAAIAGHVRPIFLAFRGGKAVATGGGVLLVLFPLMVPIGLAARAIGFAATRISAVGSLVA
ncbi:MAG TPA: glycerol-3-phosphate acyltransferase, partial [Roseiflexaceae bacterium]|nr:glycerol-3-phosphate acyltransferase [Roseiflexaceae bacterium]